MSNRSQKISFHDHLRINEADLSACTVLILSGVSGSGKTTMMQHLRQNHPSYKNLRANHIRPHGPFCHETLPQPELYLIDETQSWRDFIWFLRLKKRGKKIIMASHWSLNLLKILSWHKHYRIIDMAQDETKITQVLDQLNISYTPTPILEFMARYHGSYYDLHLILETQPHQDDFDKIWHIFKSQYHIKHCANAVHFP